MYDIELKRKHKQSDCFNCRYFDKNLKKCDNGLDNKCFIYDEKTKTIFSKKTGLPVKIRS